LPTPTYPRQNSLPQFGPFDGALLVDKPTGWTSHDVVAKIRGQFKIKKVGHSGTLDPNATGLLTLLLGKGTKLSNKLMSADKVYEGEVKFGEATDSYDADGELTASLPVPPLTLEELNEATKSFTGDQMQIPPMVSAVKKDGVPLYKLARKGQEVERDPKLIHIYKFAFDYYEQPYGRCTVSCTKGTYVRSLAHELGEKLGCGAHLSALRRTSSGNLKVEDSTPLDELLKLDVKELEKKVIPILQLV
jgi:tRNA pseudouridine55 synthase